MTTQSDRVLQLSTPLGQDFLLLESIDGREALSELFRFQLHLLHEENSEGLQPTAVDPRRLLGQGVSIKISLPDNTERHLSGIINHFVQRNRDTRFTHYQATVVPLVWLLTQRQQSRIFQQQSVPDILRQVFAGFEVSFELQGAFHQRDYCVQYRESDFNFAARLMEEEGIYYYFQHTASGHKMIVANAPPAHRECPGKARVEFAAEVAPESFVSAVETLQVEYRLQSGKYTLWDHTFELPHRHLEGEMPTRFAVANNQSLEVFEYPGEYAKRYTGINPSGGEQAQELKHVFEDNQRTAQVRMQELDGRYQTITGTSDCCTLTAGHRFTLVNHPLKENNGAYVLTTMQHTAQQSPSYETGADTERCYRIRFECIWYGERGVPFRPLRTTPKPIIQGAQTAVVVGPQGEEIFTDKYGRVKVQFHWDRTGKNDAGSSCWIRVAQAWAGKNWGSVAIPRIGQEVVVEFLEGDPDRPIIVGNVYNPDQMPPYDLPAGAHTMGLKSNTTKGGAGYNEIAIVDGKAGELIRIHAQKDMHAKVLNDDKKHVINNREITVDGAHTETIKKDMTTTVTEGNQANTVSAGSQTNRVNQGISITSECGAIVITAETQIVLKVGENKIIIDASGNISLLSAGTIRTNSVAVTTIRGSEVDIN